MANEDFSKIREDIQRLAEELERDNPTQQGILIARRLNQPEDYLISGQVSEILKPGRLIRAFNEPTTYSSLLKTGIFGATAKLYEVPGEGTVLSVDYEIVGAYISEIFLLGFREDNSRFTVMKTSLEKLASQNDIHSRSESKTSLSGNQDS